jgi:hypothetical protein
MRVEVGGDLRGAVAEHFGDNLREHPRLERDGCPRMPKPGLNEITFDLRRAKYVTDAYRQGASGGELRTIVSDGGASRGSLLVPTIVDSTIYSYLTAETPVRRTNVTMITRPNGDVFQLPKVTTHGIATHVAS